MTLVVKQNPQHVHTVEAKAFALARTCTQNGRWRDLQGSFVWRVGAEKAPDRQTAFALQRSLHEGSGGMHEN